MNLIKEITALGLDPAQLVQAGIRRDVVEFCCRELALPFSSTQAAAPPPQIPAEQTETIVIPDSPAASTIQLSVSPVRNGKESKSKAESSKPPAWPFHLLSNNPSELLQNMSKSKPLSKTVQTPMEKETKRKRETRQNSVIDPNSSGSAGVKKQKYTTSTSGLGEKVATNIIQQDEESLQSSTQPKASSSSVEAMRQAALASMKRKKAAEETQEKQPIVIDTSTSNLKKINASASDKPLEEESDDKLSRIETPSGPKASRAIYHDIDAPDMQASHDDVDDDLFGSSDLSSSMDYKSTSADPRQRTRSKISYADDYSWDVDAPLGEVDLEAPLPSLQIPVEVVSSSRNHLSKSSSAHKKRPVAADMIELSSNNSSHIPFRTKPFLPNTNWQKMVVDYSDDEEDIDVNVQTRKASTALIAHIWKQMNGADYDSEARIGSPRSAHNLPVPIDSATRFRGDLGTTPLSRSPSDADSILERKEQEIRELMARIQQLEGKRDQAPTDSQFVIKAAEKVIENRLSSKQATTSTVGGPNIEQQRC